MIEIVLETVAGLGEETLLITNKPNEYAHLNLPMVGDIYPDHGPLGGIFTAVHTAQHPHVLIVACDMPWLNRPLLEYMISLRQTADIIVPRWEKFPEPLHAIYGKACLSPIEAMLKEKRLKITGFFGQMDVRFVERAEIERFDKDGRSFANINSRQDLEEASSQ